MQSGSRVFTLDTHERVTEAVVDPDHRLPDRDRTNDSLKPAS